MARGEELRAVTLGPRYAVSLADLAHWHVLKARCFACGHVGALDVARLARRWSRHARLVDLERRLRCQRCGNRHGNRLAVYQPGRNV